jgi:hypothetical protein
MCVSAPRPARVLRGATLADRVVLVCARGWHAGGGGVRRSRTRTTAGWRISPAPGSTCFRMDATGYGRSTRPPMMNDPCNLAPGQQTALRAHSAPCSMRTELPAPVDHHSRRIGTRSAPWSTTSGRSVMSIV